MIRRLPAALLVMIAVAGCTGAPPPMPSPQATMPARCGLGDGIQVAFTAQTRFDDVWDGGLPPGEGARVGHAYVSADPIERDDELARSCAS